MSVEQLAAAIRRALEQLNTARDALTKAETLAGDAHDLYATHTGGTNDPETARTPDAAARTVTELSRCHSRFGLVEHALTAYLERLGVTATPPMSGRPSTEAAAPAPTTPPPQAAGVTAPDGSRYPEAAAWCADLQPDVRGDRMTATAPILDNEDVVLTDLRSADEVLAELDEHNRLRERGDAGMCWWLQPEPGDEAPALLIGIRGDVGALQWFEGTTAQAPAGGANTQRVDYFTRWGHHNSLPPHVEVPLAIVRSAVRELATTGRRPTCVEWTPGTP